MSPSIKRSLVNAGALAGLAAVIVVAYYGVTKVLSTDALAPYRTVDSTDTLNNAITAVNSDVKLYRADRLVVSADIGRTVARDDMSIIQGEDIRNGHFTNEKGEEVFFETQKATFGKYSNSVIVDTPVHLWGKDFDLKADGFVYDDQTELITVKGNVTGKIKEGDLVAESVTIDVGENSVKGKKATWGGPLTVQETNKRSNWRIEAEDFVLDEGMMTAINARGQDDEMIIRSDKMRNDRKEDIVYADGNVRYWGKDANLTCDNAVVYRKEKRAVLTGSKPVSMLVKPEDQQKVEETEIPPLTPLVPEEIAKTRPAAQQGSNTQADVVRSTENLREYPISLEAKKIEYWYEEGSRRAIITGSPWAYQTLPQNEWRKLWAHRATYNGETEVLDLFSQEGKKDVRMQNSLGDDFLALTITVSTAEGEDKMSGKGLEGVYVPDDDDGIPPVRGNTGGSTGGSTTGSLSGPIGNGRR